MESQVQIKGIREGLLVTLGEGSWEELEKSLIQEMDKQSDFLQGAKLILDVHSHDIGAVAMGKLRDQFSDRGLSLWAVLSDSNSTESTAQALGLATRIHETSGNNSALNLQYELETPDAKFIQRTIRSGSNISFPGHVTILGDVNPGAEIIASGNIVVWGHLRGLVHAGAEGDEEAIVCALDLSPTQLRIAGQIAIPPEQDGETMPEIAFLRDGQVIAVDWNSTKQ